MRFRRLATVALMVVTLLPLAACMEQGPTPYLEVSGGGFIFNYRVATATAGVVLSTRKELPPDSRVEVSMENPAGGAPIVLIRDPSSSGRLSFVTPPLTGVKADRDYKVTVRLLAADGKELEKVEKNFRSQLDQSVLPAKPLTVGPGYTRNPEAKPEPGAAN